MNINRKLDATKDKYGATVELWWYPEQGLYRVFLSGNCMVKTDDIVKATNNFKYYGDLL